MTPRVLPIYYPERCTGCGLCVRICPEGVFALVAGRAVFAAPEGCVYCGECELACPAEAVELYFEIIDGPAADAAGSKEP